LGTPNTSSGATEKSEKSQRIFLEGIPTSGLKNLKAWAF